MDGVARDIVQNVRLSTRYKFAGSVLDAIRIASGNCSEAETVRLWNEVRLAYPDDCDDVTYERTNEYAAEPFALMSVLLTIASLCTGPGPGLLRCELISMMMRSALSAIASR